MKEMIVKAATKICPLKNQSRVAQNAVHWSSTQQDKENFHFGGPNKSTL